jgi:hypothetical protein
MVVLSLSVRWMLPAAAVLGRPSLLVAEEASESTVLVAVAARADERSALLEALREPLDSLGLTLRAPRVDDAPPPFALAPLYTRARVWIDARPLDHVDIFVWAATAAPTTPVHRVIPRSGSTAIVAEEVAYVVRATLDSLLNAPAPPPPPANLMAPPPGTLDATARENARPTGATTRAHFGFDMSAFAAAQAVASSVPAFGAGLGVDLAPWGAHPPGPTLWLGASGNAPFESATTEATLETTLYSVRAIPAVELAEFGRFHLAAGVGLGVDLLHTVPGQGSTATANLSAPSLKVDPIVEAQLLLRAPLAHHVGLLVGVSADYDADLHQYIEMDGSGASNTVFAPSRIRPAAIVGLCLSLAGDPACAGALP